MINHYFPEFPIKTSFNKQIISYELNTGLLITSDLGKQAQEVYFSQKTNKEDFQNLSFNASNVKACSSEKYLGHIMDDKLNFDQAML